MASQISTSCQPCDWPSYVTGGAPALGTSVKMLIIDAAAGIEHAAVKMITAAANLANLMMFSFDIIWALLDERCNDLSWKIVGATDVAGNRGNPSVCWS